MNKEQMIKMVSESFEELKSTISESVEQLFNNPLQTEIISEEIDLAKLFEVKGQHVCAYFRTKSSSYNFGHLFLFSPELASQLYAWMIGAEPEGELTNDHLEGLKEATDQIFGRIKMSITSDDAPALEDVALIQAKSLEDLKEYLTETEGNTTKFNLEFKDKSFELIHHFIPIEFAAVEKTEENEVSEDETVEVQPAEFDTLAGKSVLSSSKKNIDMLMDVELEVSVELGRKPVLISDVLKLGKGSILELEKSAGENLDIIVNGKKLAEGEVVVIDEHFGIRITQLISAKDRVQLLQ